jgi:hypothetical protein
LSLDRHDLEIQQNISRWNSKPLLQRVYGDFYRLIIEQFDLSLSGIVVELGSGIGNLKRWYPKALTTDLFPNPWIDQVEDVYRLSFGDNTVANTVLFDVFHHLQYPGSALASLRRVMVPGGRLIIFEPYVSVLGRIVYGLMHPEPLQMGKPITWMRPESSAGPDGYYAAQGNATRIFFGGGFADHLAGWEIVARKRIASCAYLGTGGYSGRQLYPAWAYRGVAACDRVLQLMPSLFAIRALIVLRKI